ncbi:hypothetical protein ISN45_Aa08g025640, partial [Arabidopsis thaliana x Arabidopsis arenosa]
MIYRRFTYDGGFFTGKSISPMAKDDDGNLSFAHLTRV